MGPGRVVHDRQPAHGATASSVIAGSAPLRASKPVRLTIPSAGVDAGPLLELGLDDEGQLEAPPVEKADRPGWYTGSVTPGEKGVSVLLARHNTPKGPGLLRNVLRVKLGDPIEVRRADGRTATFVVRKIEHVSREKVAVHDLQPNSRHAELRLIASGDTLAREAAAPAATKDATRMGTKDAERGAADAKNHELHYNIVFYADMRK